MLSAGFDAAVNERANRMARPRGRSRYVIAVLLELARLTPHRYRVTIDRDARQVDAVLVTVGNTASIGGGMRLTPDARPDDGLLDVLVATPLPAGSWSGCCRRCSRAPTSTTSTSRSSAAR